MRRLTKLEHHEVGDIDDVIDRADADTLNFRAQPFRTGTDFHIVDLACGEERTFARRADSYAGFFDIDLCQSGRRLNFLFR